MPPRFYANVTCPSCGTQFQTPVEQIVDVRVDPNAKNRVISGAVNVAVCPSCGNGGALSLPFIYHDPENEAALLYLPMEVGNSEVERQRFAGSLTRQLMDSLPSEERKGYLLQPETFISMETLIKRVLDLEGVSEEDMEHSRRQQEILAELLQTEEDQWEAIFADNEDLLDEGLFALVEYTMQLSSMTGANQVNADKIEALHTYLVEHTDVGQRLAKRSEVLRIFTEEPNADTLLQALVAAPDEDTIVALVQSGMQLLDYSFFQKLVAMMNEAEPAEKERLSALRRTVLDLRDELVQANQEVAMERGRLLQNLIDTEDPMKMARSHLSELDDMFSYVLTSEMQSAQQRNDREAVKALQRVAGVINQIVESSMPPAIALLRRLLATQDEETLDALLKENLEMLAPEFFQTLEALEANSRERGDDEVAEQIARVRTRARLLAPAGLAESQVAQPQASPQQPLQSADGETTTPSGLIIAKH